MCLFSGRFNLLNVLKSVMTLCPLNCWGVKKCVTDVVAILMKGVQSVMWHEIPNTIITIITIIPIITVINTIITITIIISVIYGRRLSTSTSSKTFNIYKYPLISFNLNIL